MHVIKNLKKVVNQQTFTIINSKGIHHFPGGSDDKESTCNAGDLDSIPGLGKSPGEGKGYTVQYSGLENSMDQSMGLQRV